MYFNILIKKSLVKPWQNEFLLFSITSKIEEVILKALIIWYKKLISLKYLQPGLLYFIYIRINANTTLFTFHITVGNLLGFSWYNLQ